jgi:hypothetical protein
MLVLFAFGQRSFIEGVATQGREGEGTLIRGRVGALIALISPRIRVRATSGTSSPRIRAPPLWEAGLVTDLGLPFGPRSCGPTVRVVQLNAQAFRALADGDRMAAKRASGLPLTPWLAGPDNARSWRRRSEQLAEDPASAPGSPAWSGTCGGNARSAGPGFTARPTPPGWWRSATRSTPAVDDRGTAGRC